MSGEKGCISNLLKFHEDGASGIGFRRSLKTNGTSCVICFSKIVLCFFHSLSKIYSLNNQSWSVSYTNAAVLQFLKIKL